MMRPHRKSHSSVKILLNKSLFSRGGESCHFKPLPHPRTAGIKISTTIKDSVAVKMKLGFK